MTSEHRYDVVAVGGGHAGTEAAWAASGLGCRTALVTMDAGRIGALSCNPAIGGLAKGQMVREIDALDGLMGRAIDATGILFHVLNTSRGAAVHGPRAQADKYRYSKEIQRLLRTRPIDILEGTVENIVVEGGRCVGVVVRGQLLVASAVVLTTGTFMRGLMHTGEVKSEGGRIGEGSAEGISGCLRQLGFELGRLKTGTPPRLDKETLSLDGLAVQWGDVDPQPFSELTARDQSGRFIPPLPQACCWGTRTNTTIHGIIRANLHRAPMYSGQIEAECGPRYCPSIEDKVVRFADRSEHHVFLEPESLETNEIYCNGISTSLPADIQAEIVRRIPGCEKARILKFGYAVEYDMVWPHQIDATGMTKVIEGLFLAGQINGTSGYEEAGGQGVIAGINAARFARSEEAVRLGRDTSYIGVMMDDLVTKTPCEPYRMFTSRAEHRLHLRSDNAPERLTPLGRDWGAVGDERWSAYLKRREGIARATVAINSLREGSDTVAHAARGGAEIGAETLERLCREGHDARHVRVAYNDAKYAAYLDRQRIDLRRMAEMERRRIPQAFAFDMVKGLRSEAVQVLSRFRPATLGQAGRLAGVNPADVMILAVALRGRGRETNRPVGGQSGLA